MEKQYYTPNIEDLCIGYECEIKTNHGFESFDNNKEKWVPIKIGYLDVDGAYTDEIATIINEFDDGATPVRTPYLSKEDIEKEGWQLKETWQKIDISYLFKKGNIYIRLGYVEGVPTIDVLKNLESRTFMYLGECKSINEFRKIMKWLKIS